MVIIHYDDHLLTGIGIKHRSDICLSVCSPYQFSNFDSPGAAPYTASVRFFPSVRGLIHLFRRNFHVSGFAGLLSGLTSIYSDADGLRNTASRRVDDVALHREL